MVMERRGREREEESEKEQERRKKKTLKEKGFSALAIESSGKEDNRTSRVTLLKSYKRNKGNSPMERDAVFCTDVC